MNKLKYVNIDVGTDSAYRQSSGNTLPQVQYPFGRQGFVMQTDGEKGGWFYNPNARYTEGIRVSNQPSPWLGDYGHIVMLPMSGKTFVNNSGRHSSIRNKKQSPSEISFKLMRYNIDFNLTPSFSGASMNIKYNRDDSKKFLVQGFHGLSEVKVDGDKLYFRTDTCVKNLYSKNFEKFYFFKFSDTITSHEVFEGNNKIIEEFGNNLSVVVEFLSNNVNVKMATSSISFDQAECNYESELENITHEQVQKVTESKWEELLSTVEVTENHEVFYSNLYRCFLFPRSLHEFNKESLPIHRSFFTNTVEKGEMYTDTGFWDTYRTTLPLLRVIVPNIYKEITNSLVVFYNETGWLPRWVAPYERGIMPSTLTDSVVAEAIVHDFIREDLIEDALASLKKDAYQVSKIDLNGRKAIKEYMEYGYIPHDISHESVSMTLDNNYCDYAIYQAFKHLGREEEVSDLLGRSQNYKMLFNPTTKFMERKNSKGEFDESFNPSEWGLDFCESSAWQNNFTVFHDINGLIELFGGVTEAEKRLDEIFETTPEYFVGRYGFEIHEMIELAIIENGHFAISNQPSFHLPIVYSYLGREEKLLEKLKYTHQYFTSKGDGYPGDEDNGSMAAWFVLTTIGMYPFCPVDGMINIPKVDKGSIVKPINVTNNWDK